MNPIRLISRMSSPVARATNRLIRSCRIAFTPLMFICGKTPPQHGAALNTAPTRGISDSLWTELTLNSMNSWQPIHLKPLDFSSKSVAPCPERTQHGTVDRRHIRRPATIGCWFNVTPTSDLELANQAKFQIIAIKAMQVALGRDQYLHDCVPQPG